MPEIVILCGGKGTRLREETEYKPKPMVRIGHKPILWHIMKHFSYYKLHDFILCLGYKGHVIKEYFNNYDIMNNDFTIQIGSMKRELNIQSADEVNWRITLADTGLNAMTGSRLKQIQKYIKGSYFIVTYGDAVANVDINKLIEFHKKSGKIATLTGIKPISRYGVLETYGDDVLRFKEKPQGEGYVNGGFFVFEKEIFDYIDDREDCVLEQSPLENLANDCQLNVYRHGGFWQCMDTYRDFEMLNSKLEEGETPWMIWNKSSQGELK
ncbi:MAG: glucose-1-phosphate cytidylyltransferase [Candidatus Gastranaerophilales bacterium]|nr:glucose-1-phosphate cytidylyltransferase [Candidatus Gastranaerophilales bacterium]MDD3149527.1 glucose-1-phosphate cytidylyltransferase [Candidatus Gastranaerophilales bacterium]